MSHPTRRTSDRTSQWRDGREEMDLAVARLARRLPEPLQPLASVAYNYRWSWTPDSRKLFRAIAPHRFGLSGENPVKFLRDLPELTLLRAANDEQVVAEVERIAGVINDDLARPTREIWEPGDVVAFCCAEFAIHSSLPVYSGGLGVLAGDILKEASDLALPYVGMGLLYRRGYFHQRVDVSGWQHEYWIESDPDAMPMVRVNGANGLPLTISVPVWDGEITAHVWRVNVGRVPLFLLDAELPENQPLQRWVTGRLYEGSRAIRLAQYALLGLGGVRALSAMGIEPRLFHLNEGHPALAAVELAAEMSPRGTPLPEAIERVREKFVFTTHTPVPAGNETYAREEIQAVLGRVPTSLGFSMEEFLALGRIHADPNEPVGLTPLAIRAARATNGVSRRHGAVARGMWQPLFPDRTTDSVPIGHVTNGVHLPTWMAPPMRALLDRCFGDGWERHAADSGMWAKVDEIPDGELWAVRNELRADLVGMVRRKVVDDRLARGEDIDFVQAAQRAFDPDALTLGFARRMATYKRLGLLVHHPDRALQLLRDEPTVQLVFAGKAHPLDDAAKGVAQRMFGLKRAPEIQGKVVFVEDYDLRVASTLIAGSDVWLNLPRPPMEASGTSGMKAALNGVLNLSVLDGWWAEGFDGENGWGFNGHVDPDEAAQDERDAGSLYDCIEHEVKRLFNDRDEHGVPRAWVAKIKASMRSLGPMFAATRMVEQYATEVYAR